MKKIELKKERDDFFADESFQLWISGNADSITNQKWEKWLAQNPEYKTIHDQALRIWQAAQFSSHSVPDIQAEFNRLRQTLNLPKHSPPYRNIITMNNRRFRKISAAIVSLAAVLLIAIALNISIPFFSPSGQYTTITTVFGERTQLTLSDGSTVILNGNSTLKYPEEFSPDKKRITYLKGEAYFDITRKSAAFNNEFTVTTNHGEIEVLGTRFTVHATTKYTEVVLIRGSVKAIAKEKPDTQNISASVIMKQGEYLRFDNGAQILTPKMGNIALKTSWWKNKLVLNQTSVKEIITRLEETYGIKVKLEDLNLSEKTISGSIENESLDLIIETLSKILRATVSREGNEVVFKKSII